MNEAERLLRDLREGHSALMFVPLGLNIQGAAETVKEFGLEHGMHLSIVPMITETDQKLAIGPGTKVDKVQSS